MKKRTAQQPAGRHRLLVLCLTVALLAGCSCSKNSTEPPPPPAAALTLTMVEVGLTDAYLRLRVENATLPQAFEVTRRPAVQGSTDTLLFAGSLHAPDTLLHDSTLSFGSGYSYHAYLLKEGKRSTASAPLTLATLDSTSHNFSWEMFSFGNSSSSVLNDVAIINDNDIWAVGEIHVTDSTGREITYNAVHWDGSQWELRRIPFIGTCSAVDYPPLRTAWVLSANDICFSNGGSIVHFNGNTFSMDCGMNALLDGAITKIWGSDSNNLYVVGGVGTIVHYDGSSWQRIESGTDVDLFDVWGSLDGTVVWACGWATGKPTVLLRYQNGVLEKVYEDRDHRFVILPDTLSGTLTSGWMFDESSHYVASNAGLYRLSVNNPGKIKRLSFTPYWFPGFPFRLRGNGINDMTLVGDHFMVAHFNGSSWRHYQQLSGSGAYLSVGQNGDLVCAVGLRFNLLSQAIVLVGRR